MITASRGSWGFVLRKRRRERAQREAGTRHPDPFFASVDCRGRLRRHPCFPVPSDSQRLGCWHCHAHDDAVGDPDDVAGTQIGVVPT